MKNYEIKSFLFPYDSVMNSRNLWQFLEVSGVNFHLYSPISKGV